MYMLKGFAIMNDTVCGIRDIYRDNDDKFQNVLIDAVHQLSGTNCRKLFPVVTLLQFLSVGLRHSSSLRLSLLSLLTNTLPGHSASEVTTLWHNTNLLIIVIIF